ncbi:WD repeat-containing protein [Striga asiatica]|uniref:WD repeat-containing protein n=1 Tax=Striga asiatica TaxID=4170 RepID=A0A5A7QSZ2_STRAF|nr:WD repeat-containing protein [Striga asiatica]
MEMGSTLEEGPPNPSFAIRDAAAASGDGDVASYRCVSSVLKKDGQVLCVAAANGLVYTGSQSNAVRVWKLPEFAECGQLKAKASMVVALQVSNDRVYAAGRAAREGGDGAGHRELCTQLHRRQG